MQRSFSYLLALSLGLTSGIYLPLQAQPLIASVKPLEKVRTVEGITEYTLENGLKVLLFPDSSKPTVTVNLTYLVGSRHEGYGETGMAHLLEHLLFKGTPTFSNVPQAFQERGADFNASTWYDRTNYFETMAATPANLEFALKLEADRMVNSFVRKADLDSEMTVVRNEFEAGENNPQSILEERVFSTAYLWHSYGRSTIGARSDIENVPINRLQAFYKKYYQPDNAVLVVAGQFDEAQTKQLIQQYFGPLPKPTRTLDALYTQEPAQDGQRLVTLRRVGQIQALGALYHTPQAAHPDTATIQVLDHILTNAPSGRLYKALVETQKATRVGGSAYLLHDPGAYYISAEVPKDKSLAEAQTAVDQVIQDVIAKGVTTEEVKRAQVYFDKADNDLLSDSQGLALQLSEWAAMGDWRLFFVNRERVEKVTPAQVQKVAQTYFTPVNRTLGQYFPTTKPERVEVPSGVNVATIAESYVPRKEVASGEVFDVSAENLMQRAQRSKLPGGLDLTLIAKKNRGETVTAQIALYLGTPATLVNQKYLNGYTANLLNRGTTALTRQQLRDKLDLLKAQVTIAAGRANQTTISIETIRANLPEVIALVGTMLKTPRFDAKEFAQLKAQAIAGLESQKTEPQRLAFDAVGIQTYQPQTIFNPGTLDERLAAAKKLELKDLQAFYQQYYGASAGAVAVVGDFDPAVITQSLTKAVGNWQPRTPAQFVPASVQDLNPVQAGSKVIPVPDKPNAVFVAFQPLILKETDPDFTALEAGVYILGGGSLSSRFTDRVRQKDGFSYGAGSGLTAGARVDFAILTSYAISNNENAPKVEKAYQEELQLLLNKGITAEELKRTQDALIQEQRVELGSDGNLVARALGFSLRGQTFLELRDRENRIRSLTVDQVNAALKKYVKPDLTRVIKAGDLAG
ncbi:pitrilysin family protein [Candidatus Cyanaurora vandensis]|uniref:M16 family metallopeptidase n=1 Tax=Candidatus Cyanaurora vandensis TaxID=2714958 RepID=UPI00258093B7|nr:pitrilysin family protein [Candidatus Cyanaurora vandensis]